MDIHFKLTELVNVDGLVVLSLRFADETPLGCLEDDIELRLRIAEARSRESHQPESLYDRRFQRWPFLEQKAAKRGLLKDLGRLLFLLACQGLKLLFQRQELL